MRLLYDKWRLPLDDSYVESQEHAARVFRQGDRAVYVRHHNGGLSKQEGIQRVKAHANPRHVKLFEDDWSFLFRWAIKWAEEIEVPFPGRYSIEAHYVIEGEDLMVLAEHERIEDGTWASTFVRSVEFERMWKVEGSACVLAFGPMMVLCSHSRTEDGEWFINGFVASVRADARARQLGQIVWQAMHRTRRGILTRNRSRHAAPADREATLARLLGGLSQSTMDNLLDIVDVSHADGVIRLIPNWAQRGFDYQSGYLPMYAYTIQLPQTCSDEELGAGLLKARSRCYGWGDDEPNITD
jgi:hypothetical protein